MATVSIPSAANLVQVPVNGGNLFAIAVQYYGDALQWNRIAAFNGLKDPMLPPGIPFTLLIPPVAPAATDDGYVTGGWGTVSVPINLALPLISGVPDVGNVLTASIGTWTTLEGGPTVYAPITYSFQWDTNGVPTSGATSASYTLKDSDAGLPVSVTVTATNIGGAETSTSLPVTAVIG